MLLIKDLKYLDAIQSKIKFSDGFDTVKYKHITGYETYLQNLNIPLHWYVSKVTKQVDYRDLTGPEKVKLFKNIKIFSLMPNTKDQGRIQKIQEIWDDFWVITQNLKQDFDPNCDVELFKKQVTPWFEKFLFVYPTNDVTPYMHALYAHVPEFLTLHKNLEYFTQQGMEKYDITSKIFFRSSNHRGVSALEQIFLKKSRVQYLEQVGCARVKKIFTCSNCKTEGHTMKTCTNKCKSCGFSTLCAHLVKVVGKI